MSGLDAIGALAEPNRRALYDYVAGRRDWVSREEAADGVSLQRGVAAHHLDRLADDGLLEVEYRRLTGRRGPGAGRTAKLYRRPPTEIAVTLPARQYDLAARLLAEAADRARTDGTDIDKALDRAARDTGRGVGGAARATLGRRSGAKALRAALFDGLQTEGFEPETLDDGSVVLHNCPFHRLAREHTDLICGMNLCMVRGMLDGLGGGDLVAELAPEDGRCCVRLRRS